MGWIPGWPTDPTEPKGSFTPIAVVLHRTYGAWGGDYSVGKQGIFQFLIGKQAPNRVQFMDANSVAWHCNGANFKAVGVELEGTNEEPLTDWQKQSLAEVLQYMHTTYDIPLDYLDPATVAPASVHVNDGNFRGVISHVSVQTDDGSQQHTDEITVPDFHAATGGTAPAPTEDDDDMAKPLYISKKSDPKAGIWATDGVWKRHVNPDEWKFVVTVGPGTVPFPLSDEWWDSLPTAK